MLWKEKKSFFLFILKGFNVVQVLVGFLFVCLFNKRWFEIYQ